ncbi:hypothetical protein F383_36504 [Gossypium arboreum]|uniref:Uncharacterized protein n=1 Tax=Gossypium arboreum TaxID=29729 RepID=A0A0B0N8U4_GOSAR|nr:hypothetical protein F383_36504 [Gossypium arboreum]
MYRTTPCWLNMLRCIYVRPCENGSLIVVCMYIFGVMMWLWLGNGNVGHMISHWHG